MTRRERGWSRVRVAWCGLVGGGAVILGIALSRAGDWAESAVGLAILAGFVGLLVGEAGLLWVRLTSTRTRRPAPPGARPADGVVDVGAMMGVVADEATDSAPWQRFVGLDPTATQPRASPTPGAGSTNPPLLGEVALISVFVGRDGRRWSGREVRDAHRLLRFVATWIEREAASWRAPVNLSLADTYFEVEDAADLEVEVAFGPEGDDFGPMEADATTKAMATTSRVAALLGFADVADLVAQINGRLVADAHVWLVHLKQRGRSHAIPVGDRVVAGVGVAICYARESSFPEPLQGPGRVDPTTIAHELLHLFGASDKYGVPRSAFPPGSVPRRDIMRLDLAQLDRMVIGKLTAGEVGWPVA